MSMSPAQATSMRDQVLGQIANEHKTLCHVIEHLPEDKLDYTPHSTLRSFSELAQHISATGPWFAGIIEHGSTDFAPGDAPKTAVTNRATLLDACNRMHEEFLGQVKGFSADKLTKEITFYSFGAVPAAMFLDWHLRHLIHHRGQLTVYLRTMGAKVPQIYGDSADYPM